MRPPLPSAVTICQAGVFLSGPGLQRTVTSAEDALRLVSKGDAVRAIGATDCNEHSSRSHAILSFHVESQRVSSYPAAGAGAAGSSSLGKSSGGKGAGGGVRLGKLHLVDLAGRCVLCVPRIGPWNSSSPWRHLIVLRFQTP